jgi:4-alpha-glucanotransferase
VIAAKREMLELAFRRFEAGGAPGLRRELETFGASHAGWLDDYALFMALKREHGGRNWVEWEPALVRRESAALAAARERLREAAGLERFAQFLFFRQWAGLRDAARARGIRVIGDAPIFVAHDSADVWAHPELFHLAADGRMPVVAGVPPDYFSATGQLWGNPIYRWDVMAADGYAWWVARLRSLLELVDLVRLDHFIGFTRTWEVPADATTAVNGRWLPGPGESVFRALRSELGRLPILAEDLGLVTPEVVELRDRLHLPGMRVIQFAFGSGDGMQGAENVHLPHHHVPEAVVYTGTHDNDTTRGWFDAASAETRDHARRYLQVDDRGVVRAMVRAAFASVARLAIVPLTDVLEKPGDARMNLPGRPAGNWTWRFRWDELGPGHASWLRELAHLYGRRAVTIPEVVAP